ncbi:MAG: HigA family addiction module antitoxin [Deltaproteobacteria bacterium]|nr:HigA family addiction module antitoxin [Deltaproteobacteria bacterium]
MPGSQKSRQGKLPPIHPGEILDREFLRPLGITQYRLAKAIGVDVRRIRAMVQGQRSITAEAALLLSRFFRNSAEFWMGLQSQYELESTTDRLNAVYGDGSVSTLDEVLGALQFLSLADDDNG